VYNKFNIFNLPDRNRVNLRGRESIYGFSAPLFVSNHGGFCMNGNDNNGALPGQGLGQPEQSSPQQPPANPVTQGQETAQGEQQYLTREEALRFLQSQLDKRDTRITSSFESKLREQLGALQAAKAAGLQLTPEQEAAYQQNVLQNALKPDPITQPAPAQEQPVSDAGLDPINAEAMRLMQNAGAMIEQGDPEASMLKLDGSPYEYLASVKAAAEAKAARLNQSGKQTQNTTNPPPAAARLPATGGPSAPKMSARELISTGLK
jgi:hypothetical protein